MEIQEFRNHIGVRSRNGYQTFTQVGVTDWILLSNYIAVSVSGSATSVSIMVERSVTEPTGKIGATPVAADDAPIQGNPSQGMSPVAYMEPGAAWWRIRVLDLAGGNVFVSLSGTEGGQVIR